MAGLVVIGVWVGRSLVAALAGSAAHVEGAFRMQ